MSDEKSRMPVRAAILLAVGVSCVIAGVTVPVRRGQPPGPARLRLSDSEIFVHFGGDDSKRRVSVTLANEGGEPLRILRTPVSCGCLNPSLDHATVPPGGRAVLSFDVSKPSAGRDVQTVDIHTTDRAEPVRRILVTATSDRKPPFVVDAPRSVRLVSTQGQPPATQRLTLVTMECLGEPRWVHAATASDASLECRLSDEIAVTDEANGHVERHYTLVVRQGSASGGSHMGTVVLTAASGHELTRLPVSTEVRPVIHSLPARLDFAATGQTKDVVLIGGNEMSWRVEDIRFDPQSVEVTPTSDGSGRRFRILLKPAAAGAPAGPTEVVFLTSHPAAAEVPVPVLRPAAD